MPNNAGLTNRGFEYICSYLAGSATTNWPLPKYIGWGSANGSNATTVNFPSASNNWWNVGPNAELSETRVAGTVSITGNTAASSAVTYQLAGTLTAAAAQSVGEVFIAMGTAPAGKGQAVLAGDFLPASTLLTVSSVSFLPAAAPFQLQAYNEVLDVTAVAGTVLTVSRGYGGSSSYAGTLPAGFTVTTGNVPGVGSSNPHTADTFAIAGFPALSLNANDTVTFTWQVAVSY